MLHPYKLQLLHKQHYRELLIQVEHDRLVQLVNLKPSQSYPTVRISLLITQWWTNRMNVLKENRRADGKIVMPEV